MTSGFLLINKPSGPTSHDIISQLRRITGIKQIGHAGTLDPFASGLLLVGIGEATKLLRHYVGLDKTYEAILRLGATSDTQDRTGKIIETPLQSGGQAITNNQTPKKHQIPITKIQKVLKSFIGKQKQVPPMYSAKKVGGKKLYELARQGQNIERKATDIEVYNIKLLSHQFSNSPIPDTITINCLVSSGTYIRTLAHDIGIKLGAGAYLEELKRTAIGDFKLEDAVVIARESRTRDDRGNPDVNRNNDGIASSSASASLQRPPRNDTWHQHLIPLKTVLVSGTFDGLHEGHKNYFQQARAYGQRLICIVGRDAVVEKIKGRKPRYSEKERMAFVKKCDEIDRIYLGVLDNIFDFTASLAPDVIALGYDQTAYTENLENEMKKRNLKAKVVRLAPWRPEKYKSSLINPNVDKDEQNR